MKYSVLYAALLCLTFYACSGDRSIPRNTATSLCGPTSLQIALKDQGISASLEELCAFSGYDSLSGATMLGLFDAAKKMGAAVAPVRIDMETLCGIREKSVVFVDENHFLVFCGCSRDKVMLEDPSTGKYSQPRADFLRRWNGEALLFGKAAKAALAAGREAAQTVASGPRIHFPKTRHPFGVIDETSVLTCVFPFRNTGSDTLSLKVRSGCGCAAATLSDERVPPGMGGSVRVTFTAENRKGFTSQRVDVRTNDPAQPLLSLTVTADVRGVVKLVPDHLWIDTIGCGEKTIREVLVLDPGDGKLAVERVEAPDGVTARIHPAKKGKDGMRVIPVSLTITGNQAGAFERKVVIYTNDKQRALIPLPISGEIRTEISALPPRVFFGEIRPDSTAVRELVLSGEKGKALGEIRAKIATPHVSLDLIPTDHGTRYTLIARTSGLPRGVTLRDSIQVYRGNSSRPAMNIPLYARAAE